jgi:hypothetical protein
METNGFFQTSTEAEKTQPAPGLFRANSPLWGDQGGSGFFMLQPKPKQTKPALNNLRAIFPLWGNARRARGSGLTLPLVFQQP